MSITESAFDLCATIIYSVEDGLRASDIFSILHRTYLLAATRGINLEWFIEKKMKYNEGRAFRHGNKKY